MLDMRINVMSDRLRETLSEFDPSMALLGSVVLDDFKPGWSDIDFLLLTSRRLDMSTAESLLDFRQKLALKLNDQYYRLFEGVIISEDSLFCGAEGTVVYWGTSGQRLISSFSPDPFSVMELLGSAIMLFGNDFRRRFKYPGREEIVGGVRQHYSAIRRFGDSGVGWVLDIARCLYTLRTNRIISKTSAGKWALSLGLCPDSDLLQKAITIRKDPQFWLNDPATAQWLSTLRPYIQAFADVLEKELQRA